MAVRARSQGPHEAVIPRGVEVGSCDRSPSVDAQGDGALAQACAGAGGIERGERAVRGPQEAVRYTTRARVFSCDGARLVDAVGARIITVARDVARGGG